MALICVIFALLFAVRAAVRTTRRRYRQRMSEWNSSHPDATPTHRRAASIGQMLATLWYGPRAIAHGTRGGWQDGWAAGKAWYEGHKPVAPAPTTPTPEPTKVPTAEPTAKAPAEPQASRPGLRVVNSDGSTNQPQRKATKGRTTVAIETSTGGEVTSPETLLAEAEAVLAEAAADYDDAGAEVARAEEDLARIQTMVGGVGAAKLPEEHKGKVAALTDPAARRLARAQERSAAAAERVAQAQEVRDMAAHHVQLQAAGAAGEFYGN